MAAAASHDLQPFRAPSRIVNFLEETLRCLQGRGYQQLQLLASYPSYMTGLMFHKYEEKPEEHKVYVCLPEPNNPHDTHALGIISGRNKRIAFVPKVLTEHFFSVFPGIYTGACITVAYCTGFCTPKSAQCIYNVYHVAGAAQTPPDWSSYQQPAYSPVPPALPTLPPSLQLQQPQPAVMSTSCTVCRGPANRFILPCRHFACCVNCSSQLFGRTCPTCHQTVSGTGTI